MKVLIINSVCGVGSTGKICQDLYWALVKAGHECKIAWGREKGGSVPETDTIKIGNVFDHWIHAFSSRILDNSGFCSSFATKIFLNKVIEYNPDIVHIHNLHGYYINVKLLFDYLHKYNKKVIWTLHDCWAFTGHCTNMESINCNKWRRQCMHCQQKKTYPKSYIFDMSARNFILKERVFTQLEDVTIITPSYWLKNLVLKSFLNKYNCVVVNNGINIDVFRRRIPETIDFVKHIDHRKIILTVANVWSNKKGYDDVLKLSDMIDEKEYVVVMIGVSKKQKTHILHNYKNIIPICKTNNQIDLAVWYSEAKVFFNPTYEDNYPTVNLEAQACGTPVVTYRTGGSIESVPSRNVIDKGDISMAINMFSQQLEVKDCIAKEQMIAQYMKMYDEQ